jgi:hypothetical protein
LRLAEVKRHPLVVIGRRKGLDQLGRQKLRLLVFEGRHKRRIALQPFLKPNAMFLNGHPFEQHPHLPGGERLGMRMVPRRPFGEYRIIFFQPDVIDGVLVDGSVGYVGNRATGEEK